MTQPFTVEDLYLHRKITALHCVPQVERAVCSVKSIDRAQDKYLTHLWTFPLDGARGEPLTQGESTDSSPRWSPSGDRVAFLSDRTEGRMQVHLMQPDGSAPRQLGDFPGGVTDLRWLPSGQQLVVAAVVPVDPELRGARSDKAPPERKPGAPEVAWRLPYKTDGVGYLLRREIHLYTLDAATGTQTRLTDGPFDVLSFDPSPDGKSVACSRTREGRFAHCSDLWIGDTDGRSHRRMTFQHATVMQPTWSPDGRHIAFIGALDEGDAQSTLWLADTVSGDIRQLGGEAIDVADPESVHWADGGRSVVLVRAHRGRHQVVSIDVSNGELTVLAAGDRQIGVFGLTQGRLVYSVDHPSLPSELWSCPRGGGDEVQVSRLNPWWSERAPIEAHPRAFKVPDGLGGTETIEGWLLHAQHGDKKAPMPLLNDIHGGPASFALLDFDTNVYWQALCAQGWAVLALNAVGSSSCGREFCKRLAGHWGEYDLPQHLEAIRQLQEEGVCDDRIAVAGKSYGGYLTGWATGHTDLFKAAVVMAPVGNIETHYGTSDGGYYADPFYMGSQPRFDRALSRQLSPLQYIERSTTPTLFLQGKEDERCPKCQSEELFVSLARAGETPAELVLYPGETHGFLGAGAPSCREDAARRIIEWIGRHTAPADAAQDGPAA